MSSKSRHSDRRSFEAILPDWPENRLQSKGPVCCKLFNTIDLRQLKGPRSLECEGWGVELSERFAYVRFDIKANSRSHLPDLWEHCFSQLGHTRDIQVHTYHFDVLLHRPVCTWHTSSSLCFHYLRKPLAIED